jgi:hypothetical protein
LVSDYDANFRYSGMQDNPAMRGFLITGSGDYRTRN